MESPSGRGRTPRKRVKGQPFRGFKSHLHRSVHPVRLPAATFPLLAVGISRGDDPPDPPMRASPAERRPMLVELRSTVPVPAVSSRGDAPPGPPMRASPAKPGVTSWTRLCGLRPGSRGGALRFLLVPQALSGTLVRHTLSRTRVPLASGEVGAVPFARSIASVRFLNWQEGHTVCSIGVLAVIVVHSYLILKMADRCAPYGGYSDPL